MKENSFSAESGNNFAAKTGQQAQTNTAETSAAETSTAETSGNRTKTAKSTAQIENGAAATAKTPEKNSARKPLTGARLVAVIAAVAVVSLLLGIALMQFIVSPAQLAARAKAPEAGPVTAQAENKVIANTVVARGEIGYSDAVDLAVDFGGAEGKPVVTGRVAEVGAVLNAGDIALEIAGRPVVVLPGELPAYRTLKAGMRGPDVLQLKQALTALGYGVADANSDLFDYSTANAITALYTQLGYPVNDGGSDGRKAVRAAEKAVQELLAAPDEEKDWAAIQDARTELYAAQEAAMAYMPSSEVVFLPKLPLRVDEVNTSRGQVLQAAPMRVSGAELAITSFISKKDAELLTVGQVANFTFGGKDYTAKITKISAPKTQQSTEAKTEGESSSSGTQESSTNNNRYEVTLAPENIGEQDYTALRGNNVRLVIPVAATDGEVLAVPIAALQAASNGESRVELLIKTGKTAKDVQTEMVTVETGLAADGFVEIKTTDKRLVAGAKVVVGR